MWRCPLSIVAPGHRYRQLNRACALSTTTPLSLPCNAILIDLIPTLHITHPSSCTQSDAMTTVEAGPLEVFLPEDIAFDQAKPIAAGGYGDLFKGQHSLKGTLALKRLRRGLIESSDSRAEKPVSFHPPPFVLPMLILCLDSHGTFMSQRRESGENFATRMYSPVLDSFSANRMTYSSSRLGWITDPLLTSSLPIRSPIGLNWSVRLSSTP